MDDPDADAADVARRYYECIDDGDYEGLHDLLDPDFRHRRPDQTIEGRERFVSFMERDRPRTDTVHALDGVYRRVGAGSLVDRDVPADVATAADAEAAGDAAAPEAAGDAGDATEVAVRGRVFGVDGEELFPFVDVFRFDDGVAVDLVTFTR